MSCSVCMASYNGERFIERQMRSILEQLGEKDEVIVVDDCSTDDTLGILRRLDDPRIRIHRNERNRGHVSSFARAMSLSRNEIIFLADQDDVWTPGRVRLMQEKLVESGAHVLTGNYDWMDANDVPLDLRHDGVAPSTSTRYVKNIAGIFMGKVTYSGCVMAMRRSFLDLVMPIPWFVEAHDLWIALASNVSRSNVHIAELVLRKRTHDHNVTYLKSRRRLYRKLRSRIYFAMAIAVLIARRSRSSRHVGTVGRADMVRG